LIVIVFLINKFN